MQPDVVSGVPDHGDLRLRIGGAQTLQETGCPDPACQDGDAHTTLPFAGEFTRAYALQVTLRRALARAERAATLDAGEVAGLLAARGDDLRALCEIASGLRDRVSDTVTYSPKVFVPVTHLCRDRCHYCTFATDPATLRRQGKSPFLEIDDAVEIARRGADAGCAEALLTLGTPRRIAGPRHARGWTRGIRQHRGLRARCGDRDP